MKIQIKDKRLILIDRSMKLVGDNEYEFEFLFDEEWEGKIKTARFILGDYKQDMILDNDKCVIDKNFFKGGSLKIGVYSSNVATEVLERKVKSSILEEDGGEPTVPEDLWTQLLEIIDADVQYIRESIDTLNNAVTETEAHFNKLKTTLDDQEAKILDLKSDAETTIASANEAVNEVQKTNALMEQARQTVNQTNSSVLEAEASRVLAERERVQAESLRASAEIERASSETVRKATETERVKAESERAVAETARSTAETARANAETSRSKSESSREVAEQSRANAESERETAEQNRANAESLRVEAESSRETAEQDRANAESDRASAEQLRAAAETERAGFYEGFNSELNSLKDDLDSFVTGTNINISISGEKTVEQSINFLKGYAYTLCNGTTKMTGKITLTANDGTTKKLNGLAINQSLDFVADKNYSLISFYANAGGTFTITGKGVLDLFDDTKQMMLISKNLVWKLHDGNQRIKSYPIFVNKGDKLINISNGLKIIINIYSDFYRAKTIYDSDGNYGANGDIYDSSDWKSGNASVTIPFSGYLIVRAIGINTDIVSNIEVITTHTIPQIVEENKDAISNICYAKRRYSTGENDAKNKPYITTFAHFSDVHGASTSVQRVLELANSVSGIDDIICTGDIVQDHFSDGLGFWNFIEGSEKILTVIGNHDVVIDSSDWNNLISQAQRYETFIAPYASNWGAITTENKSYYYKDYADGKLRLIVLDCMLKNTDATEQNTWLANVLSSAKSSGYSVVIAEHYPVSNARKIDCTFTNEIRDIQSYDVLDTSYQQTVQAFMDNGGDFVCYLAGHVHNDKILYNADYPKQIFIMVDTADYGINAEYYSDTARQYGEKSQDLFNLVSIDTYAKLIKIIRIGADKDCLMRKKEILTLNYSNQSVIANY